MKKILVIVALVLAVAAAVVWKSTNTAPEGPVRIAINPWPGYEFLYLAEQKGFLKEEGLNIQLKPYSSLEDVRQAFERNQVEGICSTLVEMLQAYANHGRQAQVAVIADYSNGGDVIMAREPIRSVADLKGKRIGIEAKSISLLVLARALEKNHLSLSDVKILNIAALNMAQAFQDNQIDASALYPPMSIAADKVEGVDKIFDSTEIPGEIIDVVAIDSGVIAQNPKFIPALRRAWDKALAYAKAHPDEAHALMAKREGITTPEFVDALQGVKVMPVADQQEIVKSGKLRELLVSTVSTLIALNE